MNRSFSLFDTAIGMGGIAWGDRGVIGVQLPEPDAARARARLRRRFPSALETPATPEIQAAIERISTLLEGQSSDLSSIRLDMDRVPAFERRVYEAARTIAAGDTMTYGQIASRLGEPRLAREVGQACSPLVASSAVFRPAAAWRPSSACYRLSARAWPGSCRWFQQPSCNEYLAPEEARTRGRTWHVPAAREVTP